MSESIEMEVNGKKGKAKHFPFLSLGDLLIGSSYKESISLHSFTLDRL